MIKDMMAISKMESIVENVKILRGIAKNAGLKGYSRLSKSRLVELIETKTDRKFARIPKPQTRKEIMAQAKQHGLKGISRLPKNRLLKKLEEKIRKDREDAGDMIEVYPPQKALKGTFATWKIKPTAAMDIQTFLEVSRPLQKETIEEWGLKGAKVSMVLHCIFVKINPAGKDGDKNESHHHRKRGPG